MPAPVPVLSVVVPARNEAASLGGLVDELRSALAVVAYPWEVIVVDDASSDDTRGRLGRLVASDARIRGLLLHGRPGGRLGHGQSAAIAAGIEASRGRLVATIDGDGQNDPADLPVLLEAMRITGADLVQGDRTGRRREVVTRRLATAAGRLLQRLVLGIDVRDSGCGLRVMRREVARALPLGYAGMHRFVPALATDLGFTVVRAPVAQRARTAGRSKYGLLGRAAIVPIDCLVLRWMRSRRRRPVVERLAPIRPLDTVPARPAILPDAAACTVASEMESGRGAVGRGASGAGGSAVVASVPASSASIALPTASVEILATEVPAIRPGDPGSDRRSSHGRVGGSTADD